MLMADKLLGDNASFLAAIPAPAMVSILAVLTQIRDGKKAKPIDAAIDEARQTIMLALNRFGASPSDWKM
jgi:hypothetical protein